MSFQLVRLRRCVRPRHVYDLQVRRHSAGTISLSPDNLSALIGFRTCSRRAPSRLASYARYTETIDGAAPVKPAGLPLQGKRQDAETLPLYMGPHRALRLVQFALAPERAAYISGVEGLDDIPPRITRPRVKWRSVFSTARRGFCEAQTGRTGRARVFSAGNTGTHAPAGLPASTITALRTPSH
ncbi:unnamed protein product, partial [Iphiclides podalirius]